MTTSKKTRCPHCQTAFRITESQLQAAAGKVRCGKCFKVFNSLQCLVTDGPAPLEDQPWPPSDTNAGQSADNDEDLLFDDNFDLSRLADYDTEDTNNASRPPSTDKEADSAPQGQTASVPLEQETGKPLNGPPPYTENHDDNASETVSFDSGIPMATLAEDLDELQVDSAAMQRWRPEIHNIIATTDPKGAKSPRPFNLASLGWLLGCLLAGVALLLQILYFNSLAIERNSPLWPISSRVCPLLKCELPSAVALDKILSTNLIIRSHPNVKDALLVNAVIVNTAAFGQPFPSLTLAFENLQGKIIAQRTFTPNEYLLGELAGLKLMPASKPVELELEIVDPGKQAVSFRLFIEK